MKTLKLSNNKNFAILIIFIIILSQKVFSNEPVDIWTIQKIDVDKIENNEEGSENKNVLEDSIYSIQSDKKNNLRIQEDRSLPSEEIKIVGIYDPSDNDLTMEMWTNSNGLKIIEVMNKIQKIKLSKESTDILNIALLTHSYFPNRNITNEEFLKIKSDWLLKQKNLDLIETYLQKNTNLVSGSELLKYYLNYYLSRSNLTEACEAFQKVNVINPDDYISKFKIYCLLNLNKKDEAQLQFDLLKESNFKDNFFEKKFAYLMEYESDINNDISEKTLLDFHLSHRTIPNFKFDPKITTSKLIWKYLSSSNLLESVELIDLEDQDRVFSIEKATHERNYKEEELFNLYERFIFNINQLLTVEETYKLLPNSESRALLYQCILLAKETPYKIKLIKILNDSFTKDNIPNAFQNKLIEFLEKLDEEEVPSNYTNFYLSRLKKDEIKNKKIKINNKIIHQSKLINYFKEDYSNKNLEKDLENILKKIKKDKKYVFSIKDVILLESLKSDGVEIPKKFQNIYDPIDPNIPYDIQILINKEEHGLALLRLVEVIGEDNIDDLGTETLHFIISVLNQLNFDKLRNRILLKVLPLKV